MKTIRYEPGQLINGVKFISDFDFVKYGTNSYRRAVFECYCGQHFVAVIQMVKTGNTNSCGCFRIQNTGSMSRTHGLRRHKLYATWCNMKARCYDSNKPDYKYYGGIGIEVSNEFHDFKTWFDYVTSLPRYADREVMNLSIDRINSWKNYERGNLRWATKSEQSANQRRCYKQEEIK